MEEKKKKSKVWLVLLIVVALIAGGVFAYTKYLNGDFNKLLENNEATKDLVVVSLDTEKHEEQQNEEYELSNGIDTEYYYDEEGKVEVAQIELEIDSSKIDSKLLTAAKTASKALKGVKFEYEEKDGKIEVELTVAPGDVDEKLFDKVVDLKILTQEQANEYKELLKGASAEDINKLLEKLNY